MPIHSCVRRYSTSRDKTEQPHIECIGSLSPALVLPQLPIRKAKAESQTDFTKDLTPAQENAITDQLRELLSKEIKMIHGHFKLGFGGKNWHMTSAVLLSPLSKNNEFISLLRQFIPLKIQKQDYYILPIGVIDSGVGDIALALLEGKEKNILTLPKRKEAPIEPLNKPIIILCDSLGEHVGLNKIINEVRNTSINKYIHTIALTSLKSTFNGKDSAITTLLKVDSEVFEVLKKKKDCPYCQQGAPLIEGNSFRDYAEQIGSYDSFTFWQLMDEHPKFCKVEHIEKGRTYYHYNFVFECANIFPKFQFDIATRLKNELDKKGVKAHWIEKIVCPSDHELQPLAKELISVLKLSEKDLVVIERNHIYGVTSTNPGEHISHYIEKDRENDLFNKNVLILDQAAHHFNTLSSLKHVCNKYECNILAFAVFVDRTDHGSLRLFVETEYKKNKYHYVSLYSWPSRPTKFADCFCSKPLK